ncbi:MAG: hypothetical protein HRU15_11160, partial [Planctomycetes bacterium]|nr:hypothetical protein [Planctomycetota bacterium]
MTPMIKSTVLCFCALICLLYLCSPVSAADSIPNPGANDGSAIADENAQNTPAVQTDKRAAYIHIAEDIDPWQAAYVKRAIDAAVVENVDYIVTHIDTYGGRVDSAIDILNTYLSLEGPDKPKCIAFVSTKAISAGALISYGHHQIYMSNKATIGNIGVIFIGADGEMKYAPEKSETVIRAQLAIASKVRGWDYAWLQKMTARNQKIFLIRHQDGKEDYVIEDDLQIYLADNPKINKDDQN